MEQEEEQVDLGGKAIDALARSETRYRRYTMAEIENTTDYFLAKNKIGEGGYGPVFKATLDHTSVAIKVPRPDISQGEKQFQYEEKGQANAILGEQNEAMAEEVQAIA